MKLYLQHFGHQCRLADYGPFNRLKNLFEAIPATIEIKNNFNGERIIHLRDCECKNVNAMIQAETAKLESNGAAPDDLDNQDDNVEEYLKVSPVPLPSASNCKSILHQFGYNNKTARDLYKAGVNIFFRI